MAWGRIENIPVVVVKQTDGPVTDATLNAIKEMSLYDVKDIISDPSGVEIVKRDESKAAILLPPDYENINSSNSKSVVVYVDSSDQMATQMLVPATQALFSQISSQIGMKNSTHYKLNQLNCLPCKYNPKKFSPVHHYLPLTSRTL